VDGEVSDWLDELHRGLITDALDLYHDMLDNNVAREQARMVLPQSMYTTFVAKTDLRNLLHFIELRISEHAQWEIQQYAQALLAIVDKYCPWTAEIFREIRL
jgi:thymidylate synthase (FAD)